MAWADDFEIYQLRNKKLPFVGIHSPVIHGRDYGFSPEWWVKGVNALIFFVAVHLNPGAKAPGY